MKVLIVDDSRAMRCILSRLMRELGYEVAEASQGQEALDHLGAHRDTDLLLVDWNMPVMNGLELVQAIRRNPDLKSLRLMMVTTETEMSQVAKAMKAGADEYVMKPFTKDIILEKVRLLGFVS